MEPIEGFEGLYEIHATNSRVWNVKYKRYLKPEINNKTGYMFYRLYKNGKRTKAITLHRMLALYFIPNPENYQYVDHINGNRTDNRLENLRWVSCSQNNHNSNRKGYIFRPSTGKYVAIIQKDGKRTHLGSHNTPDEAHKAYLYKSKELYPNIKQFDEDTIIENDLILENEIDD